MSANTKTLRKTTRRERIIRDVALSLGKNMTTVADEMGFSHSCRLIGALRSRRPLATTVARLRGWLAAKGVVIDADELTR